ncbi:MAG: tetratricopeptide repeat protein [Proteobacteria bacterium]|jgi:tetratricopeptide (TPR) repeat protein|nr:tetratricopeptide repeat protein [Pseudomonadota bacterium]
MWGALALAAPTNDVAFDVGEVRGRQKRAWNSAEELNTNPNRSADLSRSIITALEEAVGPNHPVLINPLTELGRQTIHRPDEAIAILDRAFLLGSDTPNPELALLLSQANESAGNLPEAIAWQGRAIAAKGNGANFHRLGELHLANGEYNQARDNFEEALAKYEAIGFDTQPRGITLHIQLGLMWAKKNQVRLARSHYDRAIANGEQLWGPDSPSIVPSLDALARLYAAQDFHFQALPILKRILAIEEADQGLHNPSLRPILLRIANTIEKANEDGAGEYRNRVNNLGAIPNISLER